ncbi:PREDICTED: ELMO domain-containing protein 2 [Nicrophorus vespilloides]|uniref:ELMO domain-containing protein 2 n=1 Tax=Nicrophorus vespilloides TaxID=110193 RepID=A0ABM1NGQ6_NICVS|nr:PREDICTED: ELMO domain-containing protein 2 [Nicrophorus vespilloides]
MVEMYTYIWLFVSYYVRPIYKWFLRKTTGLCELQRICYGAVSGAPRVRAVEKSLGASRSPQIAQLIAHLNNVSDNHRFVGQNGREIVSGAVSTVLLVKRINPRVHFQFVKSFGHCIQQIWGYRQLLADVESLRTTTYDPDNVEHERKLMLLWEALRPDEMLASRITKQWQDIGFQGDDPKTDFRGMGLLGLENLLFFASEYGNGPASHVLSHSLHPVHGYAFAIVGINLTSMAWQLLRDGHAKTYVYNTCKAVPSVRVFHQFYCYLFYEFDRHWLACRPKSMMEFSDIKTKFESNVKASLQDPNNVFSIRLADTV